VNEAEGEIAFRRYQPSYKLARDTGRDCPAYDRRNLESAGRIAWIVDAMVTAPEKLTDLLDTESV